MRTEKSTYNDVFAQSKRAILHITASQRNTFIAMQDSRTGKTISAHSIGNFKKHLTKEQLKGKGVYPHIRVMHYFTYLCRQHKYVSLDIRLNGNTFGVYAAAEAAEGPTTRIHRITQTMRMPHNGCRRPKKHNMKKRQRRSPYSMTIGS